MAETDKWLEVSLIVDGELAEAVADVLARFAPEGVVIETALKGWTTEGEGIPEKNVRVCAYLPVDKKLAKKQKHLEEALWHLGFIRPLPEIQYKKIQETNWAEAWKENFQPITVGKQIIIVPAWMETPDPRRLPIKIDPGMAFGTGTHPTTQLCLEFLEDWISNIKDEHLSVIDLGCGSGILAIAALKFGAKHVLAVDIDEQAIKASKDNAKLNGVYKHLEVGLGSVAEIRNGIFTIRNAKLIFANILAPVIIELLDQGLVDLLLPEGRMVLSGILDEQAAGVIEKLNQHGLKVNQTRSSGDWVALGVQNTPTLLHF
jgi:ribosomal protein L11 methyltransferase